MAILCGPMLAVIGLCLLSRPPATQGDAELALAKLVTRLGGKITFAGSGQAKHLVGFSLWSDQVADTDFIKLPVLPYLMSADVSFTKIGNPTFAWLARHPRLRRIRALQTAITDKGLGCLAKSTSLEALDLGETNISDKGVAALTNRSRPSALKELMLGQTNVTGTAFRHAFSFGNLRVLDLDGDKVSDAGAAAVGGLSSLQKLVLYGADLTDRRLRSICKLSQLRALDLTLTRVTDQGVKSLPALTKLEILLLHGDAVSDASITPLTKLKGLRTLSLAGTKVTKGGVDLLRSMLPNCKVFWGTKAGGP